MIIAFDTAHSSVNTRRIVNKNNEHVVEWVVNDELCKKVQKSLKEMNFFSTPVKVVRLDKEKEELTILDRLSIAESKSAQLIVSIHTTAIEDDKEDHAVVSISRNAYPAAQGLSKLLVDGIGSYVKTSLSVSDRNKILTLSSIPSIMIDIHMKNFGVDDINEFANWISQCIISQYRLHKKTKPTLYTVKKAHNSQILLSTESKKRAVDYCNDIPGSQVFDENGEVVHTSLITKVNTKKKKASIVGKVVSLSGAHIYKYADCKSEILTSIPYNTQLVLVERDGSFWKVMSNNGSRNVTGYVKTRSIVSK